MADMEEMIKQEISRINGLQERVAFKDIVERLFLSLYETNREMYRELESRVMDDLAFDINRYQIITGIVERKYLDPSHHLLSPIREADLQKRDYEIAALREQMKETGCYFVRTLFLELDHLEIERLLGAEQFGGRVRTERGDYQALFKVCRSEACLQEVSRLYQVFVNNGVPWQTVNAPYLYKFVDVFLTGLPQEVLSSRTVIQIEPDLQEFAQCVREDMIPVWNVGKLAMDSVGFPVPCEDHKSYEHTISIREYGSEHVYLVDDREHIHTIRQKGDRLIIMGEEAEARRWQVYRIRAGMSRRFERFPYPLMTNAKKDEFLERFGRRHDRRIRTGAELARFLGGFGLDGFVEYRGYEIRDREDKGASETYSMNSFILDEIREAGYRKHLILLFDRKGGEPFLLRDIMSFLVSEVQLLYGEYLCEGRLL